jgi:hypothetical protein
VQPRPLGHQNRDVDSLELNLGQTNYRILCSLFSAICFSSLSQLLVVIFTCDIAPVLFFAYKRAIKYKKFPLSLLLCSRF